MRSSDTEHPPVTIIGLGLMGRALAETFVRNGHPTTVWNRSPGKAGELVDQGAVLAGTAREAIAASPLVIVCLTDHDAVHELIDPLEDALADRVLVNLTTGTSGQARETAGWAAERGVTYLDGVILAIPQGIGTAEAQLLYSGPQQAFDAHEGTLRALADDTVYLGPDHGLSALYDAAVLTMMWSVLNGFLHGAALLGTAGVPAAEFAPTAVKIVETITGWLGGYAGQIDEGKYPALDSTLDTHVAAMEHLIHETESVGVNAELPRFIKALAARAIAEGHGPEGYAAMITRFRAPAGVA